MITCIIRVLTAAPQVFKWLLHVFVNLIQLKRFVNCSTGCGVQVVKEALLQTIEAGLPELWSQKLKVAWSDAYDTLATTLKNEMHAQVAEVKA